MSRFIRSNAGYLNLNCIVTARARYTEGGPSHLHVTYKEDNSILTTKSQCLELDDCTAPIVPAQPGYAVVKLCGDPPCEVYWLPIVAWRITPDYAHPVCPGECVTDFGTWGILHPSGRVDIPFDESYNTVTEFKRAQSEILKRRAAASRMTSKATVGYEAFVPAGWTDAQLIEHGYMRPS